MNQKEFVKTPIEFDLSQWEDPADKANILMGFILNRITDFDHTKYSKIAIEIDESPKGLVIYNLFTILAMFKPVSIYVKGIKQPYFWNRQNKLIKKVWFNYQWKKIINSDCLIFNYATVDEGEIDNNPPLFAGITSEQINLIAKHLYNWEEQC